MEPDKLYPLHSDQDDQPSTPSTPPVNPSGASPLPLPSTFNDSKKQPTTQSKSVPWYLQPLTKAKDSSLTSAQTRPFIPREPVLAPRQDQSTTPSDIERQSISSQTLEDQATKQYDSPFRSQPLPPLANPVQQEQSMYRQPPERRYEHQQTIPTAPRTPKPFSQFGGNSKYAVGSVFENKPKKSRRIINVMIAVLFIAAIGVGGVVLWQRSQSESTSTQPQESERVIARERLEKAIENNFQTRYIQQVYTQITDSTGTGVIKFDTLSDFSDPSNPKSYIRYDARSGEDDNVVLNAGEIIVVDKKEFFAKVTQSASPDESNSATRPALNRWYQVTSTDNNTAVLLDPMSVRLGLNSPMGEMPVGNFNETSRQDLMQFIRENNVYSIKNSDGVTEGGGKMTRYDIDANASQINELNKKIANVTGYGNEEATTGLTQSDVIDMQIWVDDASSRMVKVQFKREYAVSERDEDLIKETITLSLSYPSDVQELSVPDGVLVTPWPADR